MSGGVWRALLWAEKHPASPAWLGHSPGVRVLSWGGRVAASSFSLAWCRSGTWVCYIAVSLSFISLSRSTVRIAFKSGFSSEKKKVFQKTPTIRYSSVSPQIGQGTLVSPAGSAALFVINKTLNPAFLLLYPFDRSACSALRAKGGWQRAGYSHPMEPGGSSSRPGLCTANIRKPEPSGKDEAEVDSAGLFGGRFCLCGDRDSRCFEWCIIMALQPSGQILCSL